MTNNLESMSEKELLVEIAKGQRKTVMASRITACAFVALMVVFSVTMAVFIPSVTNTLKKVNNSLIEVEKLSASMQESLEGVGELANNVNQMIVDNTDAVNSALSRLSNIDIDSLNKSIQEFSAILSPIARLFGKKD